MFNQNPPFQISHNVCEKNAGNNFFHKLKLIVQTLPEQEVKSSQVDKESLLFLSSLDFFIVPFLLPEDNTCQVNNLLPNINNALFVSREACCYKRLMFLLL